MSTGISIASEPDTDIGGYYQNFAEEFENMNFLLKKDGCDLSTYLYCPESWEDEEDMREYGASEEDIAQNKLITTEEYHPLAEVSEKVTMAIDLAKSYDEDMFEHGKEAFVSDLEELSEALAPHSGTGLRILFLRG